MKDRINKTSICSVVFIDIIDYSKKPVSDQIAEKECFNALLTEAIKDVAQNDRIIIDTGDGAAIALLGAPEEALFVSLTIRDGILRKNRENGYHLLVRIGINLGPVRVVIDINGMPNIIGDGINVAQRVMSFAEPNQILVSRSYYEITSRLTQEITDMFAYHGVKQDKHVREHEVYVIKPTVDRDIAAEPIAPVAEQVAAPATSTRFAIAIACLIGIVAAGMLLPGILFAPDKVVETSIEAMPSPPESSAAVPATQLATKSQGAEKPDTAQHKNTEAKPAKAKPTPRPSGSKNPTPTSVENTKTTSQQVTASQQVTDSSPISAPQPSEKSGWTAFTQSIQQGSQIKSCSDAERALNQCH